MKRLLPLFLFCAIVVASIAQIKTKPSMGINFAGLNDWSTELPFVNIFLQSRLWISQRDGKGWGEGPKLTLDKHGWIMRLEPHCHADTPICSIEGGHFPSGIYTCSYRGRGKIEFWNSKVVEQSEGRILVDVDSSRGTIWLRIRETDPNDYIRDIKVWVPGYGNSSSRMKTDIWNPKFLDRWRGMKAVRYMDMQATNGSTLVRWSDRPVVGDATYSVRGAPIEVLCDLANRLDADPWFCVPHQASNDFVLQMARLIKANLNPKHRVYIEYSNELWNGQFPQNQYVCKKGQELKLGDKPWEAGWAYTAFRSVEIFKIFEKVFGEKKRLIRVLPSQAANPYVSEQILKFRNAYKSADALAIAPYMEMNISKENAQEYIDLGLKGIFRRAEEHSLPQAIDWMKRHKEVAGRYGLKLISYEAGQHLVGLSGANDREELNKLLYAANRSDRMGELYESYFNAWEKIGGDVLCHFSSCGQWSKWGSWGLIQYEDESADDYPKYRMTLRFMKEWNK